jgi:hypothetical protein
MTHLVGIGAVVLQIVLAVHAVRARRPFIWVFLILIFSAHGQSDLYHCRTRPWVGEEQYDSDMG